MYVVLSGTLFFRWSIKYQELSGILEVPAARKRTFGEKESSVSEMQRKGECSVYPNWSEYVTLRYHGICLDPSIPMIHLKLRLGNLRYCLSKRMVIN